MFLVEEFLVFSRDNVALGRITIGASDGYEQRYAYIYDIYQTNIYEIFIYIFNIYV